MSLPTARSVILFVLLFLTFNPRETNAVHFVFSGELTSWNLDEDSDLPGYRISDGNRVTGTLSFETTAIDGNPNQNVGYYENIGTPDISFMTLTVRQRTFVFPTSPALFLAVYNDVEGRDELRFRYGHVGIPGGGNVETPWEHGGSLNSSADHFSLIFKDEGGQALTSDGIPDDLALRDWTDADLFLSASLRLEGLEFTARITKLKNVPEAGATLLCLSLGLCALAGLRKLGLRTQLPR